MKAVSRKRTKNTISSKLYLITDRTVLLKTPNDELQTTNLFAAIEEALKGGIRAVQLREKDLGIRDLLKMAYELRKITAGYAAKLFINDRVDVAIAADADGVHLGQGSMPAHAAKKASDNKLTVGVSTHTIEEALFAEKDGADFITFGPVYPTPSKLKYGKPVGINALRNVASEINIPVFAIGGITEERVNEVMDCGADGIALISAILGSSDIKHTTERFLGCIK